MVGTMEKRVEKKRQDEQAFSAKLMRLLAATAALQHRLKNKKPPRRYPSRAVCPCRNIKQARHVNLQFIAWCEKRGIAPRLDELLL